MLNNIRSRKGEIATTITIVSLVIMLAGAIFGSSPTVKKLIGRTATIDPFECDDGGCRIDMGKITNLSGSLGSRGNKKFDGKICYNDDIVTIKNGSRYFLEFREGAKNKSHTASELLGRSQGIITVRSAIKCSKKIRFTGVTKKCSDPNKLFARIGLTKGYDFKKGGENDPNPYYLATADLPNAVKDAVCGTGTQPTSTPRPPTPTGSIYIFPTLTNMPTPTGGGTITGIIPPVTYIPIPTTGINPTSVIIAAKSSISGKIFINNPSARTDIFSIIINRCGRNSLSKACLPLTISNSKEVNSFWQNNAESTPTKTVYDYLITSRVGDRYEEVPITQGSSLYLTRGYATTNDGAIRHKAKEPARVVIALSTTTNFNIDIPPLGGPLNTPEPTSANSECEISARVLIGKQSNFPEETSGFREPDLKNPTSWKYRNNKNLARWEGFGKTSPVIFGLSEYRNIKVWNDQSFCRNARIGNTKYCTGDPLTWTLKYDKSDNYELVRNEWRVCEKNPDGSPGRCPRVFQRREAGTLEKIYGSDLSISCNKYYEGKWVFKDVGKPQQQITPSSEEDGSVYVHVYVREQDVSPNQCTIAALDRMGARNNFSYTGQGNLILKGQAGTYQSGNMKKALTYLFKNVAPGTYELDITNMRAKKGVDSRRLFDRGCASKYQQVVVRPGQQTDVPLLLVLDDSAFNKVCKREYKTETNEKRCTDDKGGFIIAPKLGGGVYCCVTKSQTTGQGCEDAGGQCYRRTCTQNEEYIGLCGEDRGGFQYCCKTKTPTPTIVKKSSILPNCQDKNVCAPRGPMRDEKPGLPGGIYCNYRGKTFMCCKNGDSYSKMEEKCVKLSSKIGSCENYDTMRCNTKAPLGVATKCTKDDYVVYCCKNPTEYIVDGKCRADCKSVKSSNCGGRNCTWLRNNQCSSDKKWCCPSSNGLMPFSYTLSNSSSKTIKDITMKICDPQGKCETKSNSIQLTSGAKTTLSNEFELDREKQYNATCSLTYSDGTTAQCPVNMTPVKDGVRIDVSASDIGIKANTTTFSKLADSNGDGTVNSLDWAQCNRPDTYGLAEIKPECDIDGDGYNNSIDNSIRFDLIGTKAE